VKREFI